ncbi:hypothetical protein [uncultured Campylobacter sp.]|uniref:hypothetical protein n=1 Tax=uncultured Campylobacter sp. TaxID=218934 RepID=UPI002624EA5B|nr:hypothetical protein [uncultured Campylobacter sp.]
MKKANLACAPLPFARISGKFGGTNLTRLQAKFENLKFTNKFCGADGSFKFDQNLKESKCFLPLNLNPKSLKFKEAPSNFKQSANPRPTKTNKMRVGKFYAGFSTEPSNFKLRNQKERTNK